MFSPKDTSNFDKSVAGCWMSGQCWMTMTPNNIRLEVRTWISYISCHPIISVYLQVKTTDVYNPADIKHSM